MLSEHQQKPHNSYWARSRTPKMTCIYPISCASLKPGPYDQDFWDSKYYLILFCSSPLLSFSSRLLSFPPTVGISRTRTAKKHFVSFISRRVLTPQASFSPPPSYLLFSFFFPLHLELPFFSFHLLFS